MDTSLQTNYLTTGFCNKIDAEFEDGQAVHLWDFVIVFLLPLFFLPFFSIFSHFMQFK